MFVKKMMKMPIVNQELFSGGECRSFDRIANYILHHGLVRFTYCYPEIVWYIDTTYEGKHNKIIKPTLKIIIDGSFSEYVEFNTWEELFIEYKFPNGKTIAEMAFDDNFKDCPRIKSISEELAEEEAKDKAMIEEIRRTMSEPTIVVLSSGLKMEIFENEEDDLIIMDETDYFDIGKKIDKEN